MNRWLRHAILIATPTFSDRDSLDVGVDSYLAL